MKKFWVVTFLDSDDMSEFRPIALLDSEKAAIDWARLTADELEFDVETDHNGWYYEDDNHQVWCNITPLKLNHSI